MTLTDALERIGGKIVVTPRAAIAIAVALLVASLGLALRNEDLARAVKVRQAVVQANILAGSVAAPLAFDDDDVAREYVSALRANPEIRAAAAYRSDGSFAVGFARDGVASPQKNRLAPPAVSSQSIVVTAPVVQGGVRLGSVRLETMTEPIGRRAMRYLGIGLVLVMASLLVAVLGGAYASMRAVNHRLQEEIANRRKAEEALLQAQKMEAMGQLTGGVAHDFNNLLTPILGSLDMLQRRKIGGEREQRLIDGALQSAERAKTLVQRLLAFARRQPLQSRAVDVAGLISGLGELLASTCGPQVAVGLDLAPGLPPAIADPHQLEMALLNLGVNARDAMPEGGRLTLAARVETVAADHPAALTPGDYIRISVTDTGTGMDEATQRRAIEPFFSTKGIGKGTGLGLSMVHGLVSQLQGGMVLHSAQGEGTSIDLYLPASAEQAPQAMPTDSLTPRLRGAGTVLLVEDEDLVRASTADILIDLGYQVVEARSGEEALRRASNTRFDLVLTDHLMPGMTGVELVDRLRRSHPDTPVVIVSGYAEASGIAPDQPRLTKPFRRDDLAALLAALPGPGRARA